MSKKRLRGAQELISQMGAGLPEEEKEKNQGTPEILPARVDTLVAETEEAGTANEDSEEDDQTQPKRQVSTTVIPSTVAAIAKIQQHDISQGKKKPKIGEIITEGILLAMEKRGLSLD